MSGRSTEEPVPLPTRGDIDAARTRIAALVPRTPMLRAWDLEDALGGPLWLKAENLQRTGSFKVRGATNWIRSASPEELAQGLVTVSAGNHALGLAWAAAAMRVPVTVVMPAGSSPLKIDGVRRMGAEVVEYGRIQQAVAHARALSRSRGSRFVHPYDDPRVIAGQGTVGLEILEQCPSVTRILCPVGGGGLISGVAIAIKNVRPDVEIVGVEPKGAATMRNAWDHADATAELAGIDTIAQSLAPAVVGRHTYAASRRYVDDIVTVEDADILAATRALLVDVRIYAETGGAASVAALYAGAVPARPDTVCIVSGGNMDLSQAGRLATV